MRMILGVIRRIVLSCGDESLQCIRSQNKCSFQRQNFKLFVTFASTQPDTTVGNQLKSEENSINRINLGRNNSHDLKKEVNKPLKRKMVAMVISYSGRGYFGMQRSDHNKTIEGELFESLLKAGAILPEQFEKPHYCRFQRASRTDKGVSAIKQIISLRIDLVDNLKDKLNEHLPEQIRVIGYKKVTEGFNARRDGDARSYSYTLPTYAFAHFSEVINDSYRVSESVIRNVNQILSMFKGKHNFYNFTAGRKLNECCRLVLEFECSKPFIRDGLELAVITVKGDSFMLHQIRKMIGLTIAMVRQHCPLHVLDKAWTTARIDIPIAPGLGLLLEEVHYDYYNKCFGGNGKREALTWDEFNAEIMTFREKFILPTIVSKEKDENVMLKWLNTLHYRTYDYNDFSLSTNCLGVLSFALRDINKSDKEKDLKIDNESESDESNNSNIL